MKLKLRGESPCYELRVNCHCESELTHTSKQSHAKSDNIYVTHIEREREHIIP